MVLGLTEAELHNLASTQSGRLVRFNRQEIILHNEKENTQIGFVVKGMVYLCAENESYDRNILDFFREGECFSSNMLIPLTNGIDYMIAKYPSEIIFFNSRNISSLLEADIETAKHIFEKIHRCTEQKLLRHTFILQQKSIRAKLLSFFRQEREFQKSKSIYVPFPYSDLADYISADRAAMMKEIGKLKNEGFIQGRGRDLNLLFI